MLDTPSMLMMDLARCHQGDLEHEAHEAMQSQRRLRPAATLRWWTGRVIIRTGEAIAGFGAAANPHNGVADEHTAIS
jgi:hypothetical protein